MINMGQRRDIIGFSAILWGILSILSGGSILACDLLFVKVTIKFGLGL